MKKLNNDMFITEYNDILKDENLNNHNIYLVQQFFIHSDHKRQKEIISCLKINIKYNLFKKIILLNEKIYSYEELGIPESKMKYVEQVNIKDRLTFSRLFYEVSRLNLNGYIVFSNSDIFFDKTILNVRRSCLSREKAFYCLLRYEYNDEIKLNDCQLFLNNNIPRNDSQDCWIYHTKNVKIDNLISKCNFQFGKPGCDNKIAFILTEENYKCYNVPLNVKIYHKHKTNIRNWSWSKEDIIKSPWLHLKVYSNM